MTPGGAVGNGAQPSGTAVLFGWGFVLLVTVGVFVGTLTLRPKRHEKEAT
jgi:hypothetical protein